MARKREMLAFELSADRGLNETRIAEELAKAGLGKVTQQAVSAMLRRVEARALKDLTDLVRRKKVRQTASLEHCFGEAMAGWEKSKTPQTTVTTKHGPGGDVKESQCVTREPVGDPRFLAEARQALADIRKIWGVDEPAHTKTDVAGKLGLEIVEEIVDAYPQQDDSVASDATGVSPE